ncbi:MAG: outer membrane lipoprotein carrier protein LolA [Thermoanaerobaculia bacterium]
MNRTILSIAAAAGLSLSLLAGISVAGVIPKSETLQTILEQIAARQKTVKTLQADFRQEKEMALLSDAEVSTGTFQYARPNKVLWIYDKPKPVTMLIANGELTTYFPDLRRAERIEVKRFEDRIFRYLGASGAIEELTRYFDVTVVDAKGSSEYRLELQPKTAAIARRVKEIKLWIDRKSYLTTKIEYVEGDGDLTRYEFSNIRINAPIADSTFTLNLPPNVRVEQVKIN